MERKKERRILTRGLTVMLSFMLAFTMMPLAIGANLQVNAATDEVCHYSDTWSAWSTTVPDGTVPSESRIEYQYRDATKGYTYYWYKWSGWSDWSTTSQTASSTKEVKTKKQYNYDRWASNSNNTGNLGPWQGSWSGVACNYHFTKGWSDTKLEATSSQQAYKNGVLTKFYLYGGNTNSWFNETTRTLYSYRTKSTTTTRTSTNSGWTLEKSVLDSSWSYGSWSAWSTTQYTASTSTTSKRDVNTRTVYRTKSPIGHSFDSGKVTRAPKYLTAGIRTYTCPYCGKTKTETIPKLNPAPVTPARAKIVSAKVKSKKVTVKWNRIAAKTKGYQVAVKNKKTQKIKIYNVKASSKSKITKTLKLKKGTYAVMVRAYNVVNGETIYGKWSNVKVGKVK